MKLAEALILRSDQQRKLASLKKRINANVLVQEGDEPAEAPGELLKQAFALSDELHQLVLKIHRTNTQAMLADGCCLLELLTRRDELVERHRIVIEALENTHYEPDRYSSREIKWITVIPVSSLQKQAEDISVELRNINIQIQAANWQIDLAS